MDQEQAGAGAAAGQRPKGAQLVAHRLGEAGGGGAAAAAEDGPHSARRPGVGPGPLQLPGRPRLRAGGGHGDTGSASHRLAEAASGLSQGLRRRLPSRLLLERVRLHGRPEAAETVGDEEGLARGRAEGAGCCQRAPCLLRAGAVRQETRPGVQDVLFRDSSGRLREPDACVGGDGPLQVGPELLAGCLAADPCRRSRLRHRPGEIACQSLPRGRHGLSALALHRGDAERQHLAAVVACRPGQRADLRAQAT
mmetsp:Transcript_1817/g.5220  ORF Transcript_1817/g.5220 Transcript_1817/m.5220 type:complete len:252 (+) Transcript_1817:744-1499(+)